MYSCLFVVWQASERVQRLERGTILNFIYTRGQFQIVLELGIYIRLQVEIILSHTHIVYLQADRKSENSRANT